MSTSISKPLPPGKDPPDRATKSPTSSLKPPKSPQPISSVPEQPPDQPTRPPFTPFFTLITDPNNSSIHHPANIHYIFSDDDPEILTTACLSALSPPSPHASTQSPQATSTSSSSSSNRRPSKTTAQTPSNPKEKSSREQRTVILSLSETGDSIVSAHSLTPTWQILSTEITNAPTWDAADADGTRHAGGLMLRIEGTDGSALEDTNFPSAGKSGDPSRRGEFSRDVGVDMQALMESFDTKMGMLRKVIEAGGSALSGHTQAEAEIAPEETTE